MRATIRTLVVGLSFLAFGGCAGTRCLHRTCGVECTRSFDAPSPFAATVRSTKASVWERFRLWDQNEEALDVTLRPEETPIPGARHARRPVHSGVLELPPVTATDAEAD